MNEVPVTAMTGTCATQTLVLERLVSSEQNLQGEVCRLRSIHAGEADRLVAMVFLEWRGVVAQRRVVVFPHLPIECIFGSELPQVGRDPVGGISQFGLPQIYWGNFSEVTVQRLRGKVRGRR